MSLKRERRPVYAVLSKSRLWILAGLSTGNVSIDLSSNAAALVRRLHATLAEADIEMLDAPLSGGVMGSRYAGVAVMASGHRSTFERVKPLREIIGNNVVYCAPIGTAPPCKLVRNTISESTAQAITELFTLGVKADADPKALWEATRRGAFGRSAGGLPSLPAHWFNRDFEPVRTKGYFLTQLMRKDTGLATEWGRTHDAGKTSRTSTDWGGSSRLVGCSLHQGEASTGRTGRGGSQGRLSVRHHPEAH